METLIVAERVCVHEPSDLVNYYYCIVGNFGEVFNLVIWRKW